MPTAKKKGRKKKTTPNKSFSSKKTSEIVVIDSTTSNKEQRPTENLANSSITAVEKSTREKTKDKNISNHPEG